MIEDERTAAINAIVSRQNAAWNRGDAAAFASDVLPDVVFTNVVGMFSVGREPFEAQHARIFSTIYRGSSLRQSIVHIAFVRPDVAIVDTLTEVTGFGELPPGAEATDGVFNTRLEQVMVLDGDQWRVASFHNVPVNPLVAPVGGVAAETSNLSDR